MGLHFRKLASTGLCILLSNRLVQLRESNGLLKLFLSNPTNLELWWYHFLFLIQIENPGRRSAWYVTTGVTLFGGNTHSELRNGLGASEGKEQHQRSTSRGRDRHCGEVKASHKDV
jgi:hypothetical protein